MWKYFFFFFLLNYWRDSKDGIRLSVYAWAESNPWFSVNLEQEAAESVDWLHTAGLLSEVVCFGHKIQECVWAFCHKNNRGSSRLRSPAESQIDSESNKHTRQHCDLESWICWITFPDWTAVILELLHFTRTRVHLKEKPLSPSIISPLQLCACEPMFLESYLYFPFTYFLFSVCGSFRANAPTTENIT